MMRQRDVGRFATEMDKDKVMVPTDLDLAARPKWDVYQNNHFAMRKRLTDIFLKVVNKQIIRMRAGKRLLAIKHRFEVEGVRTRAECKRMVTQDAKNAQNMMAEGDTAEDNILNMKFKFEFSPKEINPNIRMPLEFETNMASFMEKVDTQPIVTFDDLDFFDSIE
jgi:hypothetical protein